MGAALGALGRYEEALETEREVSQILSERYGRRNASTLRVLNNMALTLTDLERFDEATALLREILELGRETWGVNSPITLGIQQSLGGLYMRTDQAERALPLYRSTLEWRERMLGDEHPDTLSAIENTARAQMELGRHQRALALARRAWETRQASRVERDGTGTGPEALANIRLLAEISEQAGNPVDEIRWRRRLLQVLEDDSEAFTAADNVESNIRLLELTIANGQALDIANLRAAIETQLAQGGELETLAARYRELTAAAR